MVKNVYIHIPFCRRKCNYCSFVSFTTLERKQDYISSLVKEIENFYTYETLDTLYFGGGTPSLLEPDELQRIISLFHLDKKTEVTFELNPENVDFEYLRNLKETGVNRLSLGCQTFDKNILKAIGRRHSPEQTKFVIQEAGRAGFDNISLDFMYGLPQQTPDNFLHDLNSAVNLNIQHISLYGLKIDEGCYFYKNMPPPDEDLQADMYLEAVEFLPSHGFSHYEISNFARKGYESRHNLNYWNNNSYYGFGAAAHGFTGNVRYSNTTALDEYIKNPCKHAYEKILTGSEHLEEEIFLGFRKVEGIDAAEINKKFSIDFELKYKPVLDKYLSSGHIRKTCKGYKLTNSGILVSNVILSEFLQ